MASKAEDIKGGSRGLRGKILEELAQDTDHMSEENVSLMKFHGSYQQDNRDTRVERKRQGLDKEYYFMVRGKMPGGDLSAEQYLAFDELCDQTGNGTLRITSRQGFQLHGVVKRNLKQCIGTINRIRLTTSGACGDIVRNTLAAPSPLATPAHREVQSLARQISQRFLSKSGAYVECWLDGEKLGPQDGLVEVDNGVQEDEIYGKFYLPRKFKIAIAIPPRNDVDVYTNDLALIANVVNDEIQGYTCAVGGGMGMTHGKGATYPALALPLFYVPKERVIDACIAVVTTQRDFGDREDRSHARLKYLVHERGIEWFREQVESRLNFKPEEPKPAHWDTVGDMLGWNEQGDGKWFLGVWVEEGRIRDHGSEKYRTAFRTVARKFGFPMRLTTNCNVIFWNVDAGQRAEVDAILRENGIRPAEAFTEARKTSQACVALPTCGLALAESERVFPGIMEKVDNILREFGLEKEPILIRMTGCPNGCARPYNADIAIVGKRPGHYAIYAGGSSTGERMAGLAHSVVKIEDIPGVIRGYIEDFTSSRLPGESFTDWWGRTREIGPVPTPEQFHVELTERAARMAASKVAAQPVGE